MTVSNENRVSGPFVGPGPTFTYTFDVFADSDLEVTNTDVAGLNAIKVLNTDYTVNRATKQITAIDTYAAALSSADRVTIRRTLPTTQLIDLKNQGAWDPNQVEEMFDRSIMIALRQQEELDRCLKVPVGSQFDPDSVDADLYVQRPRLLAEHTVSFLGPGVTHLEAFVDNPTAYDVLHFEIPFVSTLGGTLGRTLFLQFRVDGLWNELSAAEQYAMKVLDSGGTATDHVPSVPTNFVNLSLGFDFDRGASFGAGNIIINRRADQSQGGEVNFHYSFPIGGDDLTSVHGSCFCNRFTNGIEGYRLFTDGASAEMVGTIRLWGLPNA